VGWAIAAWLGRALVIAGALALVAGSLGGWIRVQVTVPLLGRVVDKMVAGTDTGQATLLLAVAGVTFLLVVLDIASARWGLAAGLGETLSAAAAGASMGLTAYRYYQLGEQELFGYSLLELYEQYASRVVTLTAQPSLYLAVAGLAAVIIGGLLRAIIGALQPVSS
jgi:hypothetical protein